MQLTSDPEGDMSPFPVNNRDTAPERSRPHLDAAQQKFGMVPNLFGMLATSPTAIATYLNTTIELEDSSLSAIEQQAAFIATSVENGCEYCVSVHSAVAQMAQMPNDMLEALRSGDDPADARIAALARFVRFVVRERGWVDSTQIEEFRGAGFDDRSVLDVITAVALKTLSNYANHIANTPLDAAFESAQWTSRQAA
jgi:uncharacterized peroxidase-related enzyme